MGRISGQQRYAKDVQYKINDMKQITISIILLLLIGGTAYFNHPAPPNRRHRLCPRDYNTRLSDRQMEIHLPAS